MASRADSASSQPEAEERSFESALDRLEAIVGRLEKGELPLEEALEVFEEGVRLSRRLAEQLARAERRIQVLVREGGVPLARPLEESEEPR